MLRETITFLQQKTHSFFCPELPLTKSYHTVTDFRKKSIRCVRIIARRMIGTTIIFGTENHHENIPI